MRKETRAIFVESPVNPSCRVLDLRPISYLTKEGGLALVVDSTFASPVNFRPLEHGATSSSTRPRNI
jgi:cystathionine beta-lyase/cystathionine gamma-synthase